MGFNPTIESGLLGVKLGILPNHGDMGADSVKEPILIKGDPKWGSWAGLHTRLLIGEHQFVLIMKLLRHFYSLRFANIEVRQYYNCMVWLFSKVGPRIGLSMSIGIANLRQNGGRRLLESRFCSTQLGGGLALIHSP